MILVKLVPLIRMKQLKNKLFNRSTEKEDSLGEII